MKTKIPLLFSLAVCLRVTAWAETVEMTAGPDLGITYDSTVWKPLAPLRAPDPGSFQTMTWAFQNTKAAQVTVASHPNSKTEEEFKRETLDLQKFRGDPAELVRERRETLAGRNWLVLEFRNPNTRPNRSEVHYFLPTADGYVRLFVIGEEASMPKQYEAIKDFLGKIQLQ